jgi:hypothetical protein
MFKWFVNGIKFSDLIFGKKQIVDSQIVIVEDSEQPKISKIDLARKFLEERGINEIKPLFSQKPKVVDIVIKEPTPVKEVPVIKVKKKRNVRSKRRME